MASATAELRERTDDCFDTDALAESLMLVRASTLSVVRLQLAVQRGDRGVAAQTVDYLVDLDRHLQQLMAAMPGSDEFSPATDALDAQRSALNREKLALAAGIRTRVAADEPLPSADSAPEEALSAVSSAELPDIGTDEDFGWQDGKPSSLWRWCLGGLLVFLAVSILAYFAVGLDGLAGAFARIVESPI